MYYCTIHPVACQSFPRKISENTNKSFHPLSAKGSHLCNKVNFANSFQGKEYVLLTSFADRELTEDEMAVLQRWLREESGSQNVSVWFYD